MRLLLVDRRARVDVAGIYAADFPKARRRYAATIRQPRVSPRLLMFRAV